jgi:uncharacterized protein
MNKCFVLSIIILSFLLLFFRIKKTTNYEFKTLEIRNQKLSVQIADNDNLRNKGLSNQISLCSDCGMLFVFETYVIPSFWMKEMNFPLDFIWIKNNFVVDITNNVSIPKNNDINLLPTYRPTREINMMLEINSGKAKEWGINIGDHVKISK